MDARHKKGIRRRRADGPEPGLRKISPEIYSKANPSRGTTTKQNNKKIHNIKKEELACVDSKAEGRRARARPEKNLTRDLFEGESLTGHNGTLR